MKRYLSIIPILSALLFTSCSVTKEAGDRQFDEAAIRQAVESRRFIVKLDRMYSFGGRMFFLRPRSNYIIIDGQKAIISTAYVGTQYDIRPIAGINMRGKTTDYRLIDKNSRGSFQVSMKVGNQSSSFNVYLTIGKSGSVSASVNGLRIENARYTGYIVPMGAQARQGSEDELI